MLSWLLGGGAFTPGTPSAWGMLPRPLQTGFFPLLGFSSASPDVSILLGTPQSLPTGMHFPGVFSSMHLSISEVILFYDC